jgi:hypothetical protein
MYSIVLNLNNVFIAGSNEAILQISPTSTTANTAEGNTFIPASSTVIPTYTLTSTLNAAFEPGDQRKINWTKSNTIGTQTYTYPFKYKIRNTGMPYTELNMALRLSELYLIRAEARTYLHNIDSAKADLNKIRSRAGVSLTVLTDETKLLGLIEHERQVEFFAEWGHRWFDLRRLKRINSVLSNKNANWNSNMALYPISYGQIQLNNNLKQNDGYQ